LASLLAVALVGLGSEKRAEQMAEKA